MKYTIKGNLRGYLCDDCFEFLEGIKVHLYQSQKNVDVRAAAELNKQQTFVLVTPEEAGAKEKLLVATAIVDVKGNFEVELNEEQSSSAFDIDFECGNVPHWPKPPQHNPVQFYHTTIYPQWQLENDKGYYFRYDFEVSAKWWCYVRGHIFDVWTICGHLFACGTKKPVHNVKVTAWDDDFLTDDNLGSAITDVNGHFTINYTSADFKKTFLSPFINVETDPGLPLTFKNGPDVYFKYEYNGVAIPGETPAISRKNVGYCLCVELCIEPPVHLEAIITEPVDCTHGDGDILPGFSLAPIKGTAAGVGFSYYEIELLWNGTLPISNAIIYSNSSNNPDTGLTQGNHEVNNNILGFVDLAKAATEAGANILTSTIFQLRLKVTGIDASFVTANITFEVAAAKVYIGSIGGAAAVDVTNPNEQLVSGGSIASVGGSIHVRGACNIYGCDSEKIAAYNIWAINDDFAATQPANNSLFNPAGWTQITHVDYANDDQRSYNVLDGSPFDDVLTNVGWSTRKEWVYFDGVPV